MDPEPRTCRAADGTDLAAFLWRPEAPRAALVYLHGIQSHSGWYAASSRRLAEAGVAVLQLERRGSGTDRAHPRGHVDRAETWLADVHAAAGMLRAETSVPAVHLLGVSWGGKQALAAAGDRPDLYRSLLLAAPGLVPKVDVVLAAKVRIAAALAAGRGDHRFPIPLGDPALFTANPDRQRFIASDPLALREVTARFLFESRRLDRLARRAARRLAVPVWLALAETDRIIDNDATRRLVARAAAPVRKIVTPPGSHHTLEFDTDPEPYFAALVAWIDRVERAAAARPA